MRVGLIGAGKVGTALAHGLTSIGVPVVAVSSRRLESAQQLAAALPACCALARPEPVAAMIDLLFLTVSDDAIAPVAAQVGGRPGLAVVHCSGACSVDVLAPAAAAGSAVGGFHPLLPFAGGAHDVAALADITYGIEAEGALRDTLCDLARRLGGRPLVLRPGDKALYHASGMLIGNFTVTLAALAAELWEYLGVPDRDAALAALLPLLRGTLRNLETQGLPHALTGPIARGDVGTVERHLAALEETAPHLLTVYRTLARATAPLGEERGGLAPEQATRLRAVLGAERGDPPGPLPGEGRGPGGGVKREDTDVDSGRGQASHHPGHSGDEGAGREDPDDHRL